jgi:hypothetical protein
LVLWGRGEVEADGLAVPDRDLGFEVLVARLARLVERHVAERAPERLLIEVEALGALRDGVDRFLHGAVLFEGGRGNVGGLVPGVLDVIVLGLVGVSGFACRGRLCGLVSRAVGGRFVRRAGRWRARASARKGEREHECAAEIR